jgi:hypothetical protein
MIFNLTKDLLLQDLQIEVQRVVACRKHIWIVCAVHIHSGVCALTNTPNCELSFPLVKQN